MKFTFLSKQFYQDYPQNKFEQLELKDNRPYAHVVVETYGKTFYLPLRSNINHPHAFFTNKKERCGIDYSKAVILKKDEYLDKHTKVYIRKDEFKKLKGKDYRIKNEFEEYIKLYKKAKTDITVPHREDILEYSSLQYFEEFLYESDKKELNSEQ